jgi:hypothetical protein
LPMSFDLSAIRTFLKVSLYTGRSTKLSSQSSSWMGLRILCFLFSGYSGSSSLTSGLFSNLSPLRIDWKSGMVTKRDTSSSSASNSDFWDSMYELDMVNALILIVAVLRIPCYTVYSSWFICLCLSA